MRAIRCDVSVPGQIAELAALVRATGRLRSVVHTAGLSPSMAAGRRVLEVNLAGTVLPLDAFFPIAEAGTGVVAIAALAAHFGLGSAELNAILDEPLRPGFLDRLTEAYRSEYGDDLGPEIAYSLSKQAMVRLIQRLTVAWGAKGARLCTISPGLMDTPMGRQELAASATMGRRIAAVPVRRPRFRASLNLPGRAEDIAQAAAFLCSDSASHISGIDLLLDDGLRAAMSWEQRDSREPGPARCCPRGRPLMSAGTGCRRSFSQHAG